MTAPTEDGNRPALRVVGGGEPTAEELAAVVVALTLRPSAPDLAQPPRSPWAGRLAMQRQPLQRGADAWRWSLRRS